MDLAVILAIAVSALTVGVAAVTTVLNVGSDFRAQRDLARLMAEPGHSGTLHRLQEARGALTKESPDQAQLDCATEVVQTVASELPRREKRAVLAHLKQSPEENVATYVVSLIDEAEHRTSTSETTAGA